MIIGADRCTAANLATHLGGQNVSSPNFYTFHHEKFPSESVSGSASNQCPFKIKAEAWRGGRSQISAAASIAALMSSVEGKERTK